MKGQAKALIPASIGIAILLLTGITGYLGMSGEKQATQIAETRALTTEQVRPGDLGQAFHAAARLTVEQTSLNVATELAVELKSQPAQIVAQSDAVRRERG